MYSPRGCSLWIQPLAKIVPLVVLPVLAYHLLEHPRVSLGSRIAKRAERDYEQHEAESFREMSEVNRYPPGYPRKASSYLGGS